jgi:hypothetical protein
MTCIFIGSFYMIVGAVCGLVSEEVNHQASSNGYRDVSDYVFAAAIFAFLWPFLIAEIVRKNPS